MLGKCRQFNRRIVACKKNVTWAGAQAFADDAFARKILEIQSCAVRVIAAAAARSPARVDQRVETAAYPHTALFQGRKERVSDLRQFLKRQVSVDEFRTLPILFKIVPGS